MNSGLPQIATYLTMHNQLGCVCSACEHQPHSYSKGYLL